MVKGHCVRVTRPQVTGERVSRQPLQLALRVRVTGAQNFSRQGLGMNIVHESRFFRPLGKANTL
ncbi:MAG: hypothetical protein ACHBN1_14645 [Heteroscytonema crispum UTEX LB 1556]